MPSVASRSARSTVSATSTWPSRTRPWLGPTAWPAASESTRWTELARSACEDVKDDDDRELVLTDLETLWAIYDTRQQAIEALRGSD